MMMFSAFICHPEGTKLYLLWVMVLIAFSRLSCASPSSIRTTQQDAGTLKFRLTRPSTYSHAKLHLQTHHYLLTRRQIRRMMHFVCTNAAVLAHHSARKPAVLTSPLQAAAALATTATVHQYSVRTLQTPQTHQLPRLHRALNVAIATSPARRLTMV